MTLNSSITEFFNAKRMTRPLARLLLAILTCPSGSYSLCAQEPPGAPQESAAPSLPVNSKEEEEDLLSGDFSEQWRVVSADKLPNVWKVVRETPESEPVLICTGEIKGFAATKSTFADFELTVEWKYPKDANGNSGILIYTQDEERIWPSSVQIQLHQPKAGSIFPSGDTTTDNTRDVDLNLARAVDTWNECRITSRAGRIAVEINGTKAGEVSGAKPAAGSIALQSEGSEVHFRRLKVRKLPAEPTVTPANEAKSNEAPVGQPTEAANSDKPATTVLP